MIVYREVESPLGVLLLTADERGLWRIDFGTFEQEAEQLAHWLHRWSGTAETFVPTATVRGSHTVLDQAELELNEYFSGKRQRFEVPLAMKGTDFQKRVWEALTAIPYGESRSYKQIGEAIASPLAMRAVGGANNRNPISIIVPCHRVIGKSGSLVGYGGGLDKKEFLLQLEKRGRA